MKYTLPSCLVSALLCICKEADTPRSLAIAMMVKHGEWDQLALMDCDPRRYLTATSYYTDCVVTELLRKFEPLPTSFDRSQAAEDNFWKAEKQCYKSNQRLIPYLNNTFTGDEEEFRVVKGLFSLIKKNVTAILGPCPPDDLFGKFGPGATYSDRGTKSTVPHKMSTRPTLTSDAYPFLFPWSGTAWASACAASGHDPLFVKGNRFTTVPKDCKKDRGIAVEPSLNVFFQLGVGKLLKRQLRRSGLDLRFAQDVHRQVACEASITGLLCTMDLSNASDTISTSLVKLALPSKWYDVLSSLRSPYTEVKGKWVFLEKFSSMGNGYTFELETILFLSIVSAVMESTGHKPVLGGNLYAFGDDLIFPSACYSDVKAVMSFLGLTVNEDKTFVSGPFRESCGGDFFNGADVRPLYVKEDPCEPQHLISIANGLRRCIKKDAAHPNLVRGLRNGWFSILNAIPSHIRRIRGPDRFGDLVIHDDEGYWAETRWRNSIRYRRVYVPDPKRFRRISWERFAPEVVLASAVYGTGGGSQGVIPRDAVRGYRLDWYPDS